MQLSPCLMLLMLLGASVAVQKRETHNLCHRCMTPLVFKYWRAFFPFQQYSPQGVMNDKEEVECLGGISSLVVSCSDPCYTLNVTKYDQNYRLEKHGVARGCSTDINRPIKLIAGEQGKKCESETVDILHLRTTVDVEWCFFSSSPSAIKRKRLRGSAHRISLTQSLLILPLFFWLMLIGANHV